MHQFYLCLTLPVLAVALSRTSPPSGALVVRQSGTQAGEYKYVRLLLIQISVDKILCSTVSAAVAALGSSTTTKSIFIYPGTYHEQVLITYPGPLTIYGYTNEFVFLFSKTTTCNHKSIALAHIKITKSPLQTT